MIPWNSTKKVEKVTTVINAKPQPVKFQTLFKKITFHPEVQKYIDTLKWPIKLPDNNVKEILE
jgi:hypothetical protein